MSSQPQKKRPNRWLALINIPIQMGVIIFLFSYLGRWLDGKFPNPHRVYVKVLTVVGVLLAFYNVNRQLQEINKQDDNQ